MTSATQHMFLVFMHTTNIAAVRALRAGVRLAGALVVLALGACICLLVQPDLWGLVFHALRLAEAVQAWRDAGPHNSLLGRMRARLAVAGLLAAPRDPLAECGVPDGEGLRHVVQLMLLPFESHACLERQVLLAWEEHLAFMAALLAVACLGLLALCLLGWAWRRHHHPAGTGDDAPHDEGQEGKNVAPPDAAEEGADIVPSDAAEDGADTVPSDAAEEGADTVPSDAAEEGADTVPSDAAEEGADTVPSDAAEEGADTVPSDAAEEGADTVPSDAAEEGADTVPSDAAEEGADTVPSDAAEEGKAAPGGEAPSRTPADPGRGKDQLAGLREVRHSLHVPPSLRERLAGPQGHFLEYLGRRHNVLIFMDAARRRMHVKGAKEDVVLCCGAVRALLAQWRRPHAAAPE